MKGIDKVFNLEEDDILNAIKSGTDLAVTVSVEHNDNERIIVCVNLQNSILEINLEGEFESFITKQKINSQIKLPKNEIEILIEKKKK